MSKRNIHSPLALPSDVQNSLYSYPSSPTLLKGDNHTNPTNRQDQLLQILREFANHNPTQDQLGWNHLAKYILTSESGNFNQAREQGVVPTPKVKPIQRKKRPKEKALSLIHTFKMPLQQPIIPRRISKRSINFIPRNKQNPTTLRRKSCYGEFFGKLTAKEVMMECLNLAIMDKHNVEPTKESVETSFLRPRIRQSIDIKMDQRSDKEGQLLSGMGSQSQIPMPRVSMNNHVKGFRVEAGKQFRHVRRLESFVNSIKNPLSECQPSFANFSRKDTNINLILPLDSTIKQNTPPPELIRIQKSKNTLVKLLKQQHHQLDLSNSPKVGGVILSKASPSNPTSAPKVLSLTQRLSPKYCLSLADINKRLKTSDTLLPSKCHRQVRAPILNSCFLLENNRLRYLIKQQK